jgi:hypothetical protein
VPQYANASGKSNVASYEEGEGWIAVTFKDGSTYTYTDEATGAGVVDVMKRLAASGFGLNGYITRHVRKNYASKS